MWAASSNWGPPYSTGLCDAMTKKTNGENVDRSNLKVALICSAVFCTMVGVSFAAVPMYDLFCRVTGYGGTTQRVEQYSDVILDRNITVRFDANTTPGLPWE